jgi:cob(I)alamin adenosyltransferase
MKIYTKTGDQGQTRLVDGQSVSKSHPRLHAYGSLDELNSFLGLALSECSGADRAFSELQQKLRPIQNYLFNVGSHLACEKEDMRKHLPALESRYTEDLEKQIDAMTAQLEPLKEFILPGGCKLAGLLHVCRTVCRRTERHLVELILESGSTPSLSESLIYLNRLSDYLFVCSRYANFLTKIPEPKWVKDRPTA